MRLPWFDPDAGVTIRQPEEGQPGFWVGSPSVLHEPARGRFLLTYRERRPRGSTLERGWRVAVAESSDGVHFDDIWEVEKPQLGTSSMERAAVVPDPNGGYLLYLSYVDPVDGRWRIDLLEADAPDRFEIERRRPVLTAASTQTEGVKDPHLVYIHNRLYLFASFARGRDFSEDERHAAHATDDVYATGLTTFPTGLAVSEDGRTFSWKGEVLGVGTGWDRYQSRLTSIVESDGIFVGLYDGSDDVTRNYEEMSGIAISSDLHNWTRLTTDGPWLRSSHASGSLRYTDVVVDNGFWVIYYELARGDGAHELRMSTIAAPAVA